MLICFAHTIFVAFACGEPILDAIDDPLNLVIYLYYITHFNSKQLYDLLYVWLETRLDKDNNIYNTIKCTMHSCRESP
jgi:hypothetical protein